MQLLKQEPERYLLEECYNDIVELESFAKKLEIKTLLGNKNDLSSCFLEIHSGAGGTESNDWAEMLLNMYIRWAKVQGFESTLVELSEGDEIGIKSATLKICGEYAYGMLKVEQGVHRLVRLSPFDSNNKRHTSFAAVSVHAEVETSAVEIKESDLKIDTFRASGAGGQHVNKTDSAVRIKHLPTGIVVQSQADRSQIKNRSSALKLLQAKLNHLQETKAGEAKQQLYQDQSEIGWGYRARSYVLHPYRLVKDARTHLEHTNPDEVLQGNIQPFIKAMLVKEACEE